MELIISNEIQIREATPEVVQYCRDNLVFLNPEYQLRQRRGMWLGKHHSTYICIGWTEL